MQAARGVHGGFGFLFQASGFRISESLLDVLPEDPYWMSLAAGLVNTLTVALAALPWPRCWAWRWAWRACRPSRWRRGWRPSSSRRCATPVLLQLFVWYGLLLLPDARQAWEPLPSVLLSNRGLALPALHGWLPQAASLIVAMLIAGWAIRRRRLATDGPAHRGHVLLIRVAPWLALAAQLLAWTLLPAPIVELPVRRGLGLQGGWQPSIEFATLVIGLSVFHAAYIADARLGARGAGGAVEAGQALALSRHILRLVVAPNAARVALPPYANRCLALIQLFTLAIAIGYQDLMAVINTAITQTGLALEGISLALAISGPGPGAEAARCRASRRLRPWARTCPVAVRRDAAGASRPALVACAALLAVAVALGAGRLSGRHAPASPSPRWRCRRRASWPLEAASHRPGWGGLLVTR